MKTSLLSLFVLCFLSGAVVADVNIVTSIRPLELIARAVVGEQGKVTALVDLGQSPHHYTMSPSDRVALANAQLLIRIDPAFEVYLTDVFAELGKTRRIITATAVENIVVHSETNGETDPHLWLNSRNAVSLAEIIARESAALDPQNAAYFQHNYTIFRDRIAALEIRIAGRLAESGAPSYVVYHNALRYFEEQFGVQHGYALLHNPDIEPNVQQILAAREYVKTVQPDCLLMEADAIGAIIDTMLGGAKPRRITLDLLGSEVNIDAAGYGALLENLANSIGQCAR